ncbi:unnamed protein product [Camellia sinensis]
MATQSEPTVFFFFFWNKESLTKPTKTEALQQQNTETKLLEQTSKSRRRVRNPVKRKVASERYMGNPMKRGKSFHPPAGTGQRSLQRLLRCLVVRSEIGDYNLGTCPNLPRQGSLKSGLEQRRSIGSTLSAVVSYVRGDVIQNR